MFCSRCGKELDEKARFCSYCGAPVTQELSDFHKAEKKSKQCGSAHTLKSNIVPAPKKSLVKKSIVVLFCVCLLVCISLYGFSRYKGTLYDQAVTDANEAMAERQYEDAIELLQEAIKLQPDISQNYLTLATAYVEAHDLYSADRVLKSGYSVTEDSVLQNASIWGPMSDFEIALWSTETYIPYTRQEYHFSDDGVLGLVNSFGSIAFVNHYFFNSEGQLEETTLSDYSSYLFGGGAATILDPYSGYNLAGEPDVCLDYSYDNNGKVVSVQAHGGDPIATISYGTERQVELSFEGQTTMIEYTSDDRVSKITFPNNSSYSFQYDLIGNWTTIYSADNSILNFNKNGLFIGFEGDDADAFTLELDDYDRIISVKNNNGSCVLNFSYLEDGALDSATRYFGNFDETALSAKCIYSETGQLIRIDYSENGGSLDGAYRELKYNESGDLTWMGQFSEDEDSTWESNYTYDEFSHLQSVNLTQYGSTFVLTPQYNEWGGIKGLEYKEAVYRPGTYTGTGMGFSDDITVSVTVDQTDILSIVIEEEKETAGVGTKAFDMLPDEIIAANSPNVDVVTGATITSKGILEAVEDALQQAKGSD